MNEPKWFTIPSGPNAGRRHLTGWFITALKSFTGEGISVGVCPRCFAMVTAGNQVGWRDETWAHEQWHAGTDYPDPDTTEEIR